MARSESELAAARLRTAIRLHNTGVEMMRQNLMREHPGETSAQINDRLNAWLCEPDFTEADLPWFRPRQLDLVETGARPYPDTSEDRRGPA